MARRYQPFLIRVVAAPEGGYTVAAEFQGAAWSGAIPADLPLLTAREREDAPAWLERGFVDPDFARDFGARLFETLFAGEVEEGFRVAYERVAPEDGLRIVLTLPPALSNLPWELLFDPDGQHGFLARSATAPLVRHFAGTPLPHPLPEAGPLRILIVTASPQNYPRVAAEEEIAEISRELARRQARIPAPTLLRHALRARSLGAPLQRWRRRQLVELTVLQHATRARLQEAMIEARAVDRGYHVVHFVGHGGAGDDEESGYLLFETAEGRAEPVPAGDFAELVAEPTVNLAVLNACQTAMAVGLFNGVAQATLKRGVSAVVGMQVPILDRAAVTFAEEFYGAWAAGEPIEGALAYARRLMRTENARETADWGIPILYMGPLEGLSLALQPSETVARPLTQRWWFRLAAGFVAVIVLLALLLQIPSVARWVRSEVPGIRCAYPYPMQSEFNFNVAVAEFDVRDAEGRRIPGADGAALATYLYQQLAFTFDELGLDLPYEIRSPAYTCVVQGASAASRAENAAQLAERIGANVLVYGVVTQYEGRATFSPEFYIDYRGFEDAPEVIGQHALGDPVRIAQPFDAYQVQGWENRATVARIRALSYLTIGLSYYATDDFARASEYFASAEAVQGWLQSAGKEVVYLLMGNANVRRASKEKTQAHIDEALDYYQQALAINPAYARAKVGEASALYLQALGDPRDPSFATVDDELLDAAVAAFETALTMSDAPPSSDIAEKVDFGLGQVYLVRAQTQGEMWLSQAETAFERVIAAYEAGDVHIQYLPGHAYARLGLLARLRGELPAAIAAYEQAVKLVTLHYQGEYQTTLGGLYLAQGDGAAALAAYADAVAIAESLGEETSLMSYLALQAEAYVATGSPADAIAAYEEALAIAISLGDETHAAAYRERLDALREP